MLRDDIVHLRKLELADLERTWQWMQNPDVYLKIGIHIPISRTEQERWFDRTDASKDKIVFAVCLNESDKHVGNVSLDNIDLRHRNARISIFIGDREERGNGLGSSALRLLSQYAFNFLNLHKIWCKTSADDELVLRFYEKSGWAKEGVLREHEYLDGCYRDKVLFGITQLEYRAITYE